MMSLDLIADISKRGECDLRVLEKVMSTSHLTITPSHRSDPIDAWTSLNLYSRRISYIEFM